jgi:hypothetical protein
MADYLVRSITDGKNVIGLACVSTDLVGEAARIHGTSGRDRKPCKRGPSALRNVRLAREQRPSLLPPRAATSRSDEDPARQGPGRVPWRGPPQC